MLIVALVLLAIVTLLGISGMSGTQVELRMSANAAAGAQLRTGAENLLLLAIEPAKARINTTATEVRNAFDCDVRDAANWTRFTRGGGGADALPAGSICSAGQWCVQPVGAGQSTTSFDGLELDMRNFELQAECHLQLEAGIEADTVIVTSPFPSVRMVTGLDYKVGGGDVR